MTKKTKLSKKKLGGEFDKPIPPPILGLLMSEEQIAKALEDHLALEIAKLDELSKHYGVSHGNYLSLSLKLAREYVLGFEGEAPKGRPKKWSDVALGTLYAEVQRKRDELGLGARQIGIAARELAKEEHWSSFLDHIDSYGIDADPGEALRKAYYRSKKNPWSGLVLKAYMLHKEQDTLERWRELVEINLSNPTE